MILNKPKIFQEIDTINASLIEKANQNQVDSIQTQITNIGNASPKGVYTTLSSLQTAYPTGTTGIYVVSGDGNWYYWNGSAWTSGGIYQSTGIADKSITASKLSFLEGNIDLFNGVSLIYGKYAKQVFNESIDTLLDADGSSSSSYILETTGIIALEANSSYTINRNPSWAYPSSIFLWDETTRLCIGYVNLTSNEDGSYTFNTGGSNKLIRIQFTSESLPSSENPFHLVKGTSLPDYYGVKFSGLILDNESVSENMLDTNTQAKLNSVVEKSVNESSMSDVVAEKLHVNNGFTLNIPTRYLAICGEDNEYYNYGCVDTFINPDDYALGYWDSGYFSYRKGAFKILGSLYTTQKNGGTLLTVRDNTNTTIIDAVNGVGNYRINPIPTNPVSEKNILFIGDSLIANKVFTRYFIRRLVNTYSLNNYKLVGRCLDESEVLNKFEAQGGFSWNNYTDNPNTLIAPYNYNRFWDNVNNTFSIQYYMNTYCEGKSLDYMIINLGWNHFVNSVYSSNITTITTLAKSFLDKLHTEYPNCKVLLNGIHCSEIFPKTGISTRENAFNLNTAYKSIAENGAYSSWVQFVHISSQFDARYGMQKATRLKSKWSSDTEEYISDIVHPNDLGYEMHAYADMVAFMDILNNY